MSLPRTLLALAGAALTALAAWGCGGVGDAAPGPGFERGPYLVRVTETTARLGWIAPPGAEVSVRAAAAGAPEVEARGGLLEGLTPDTRYAWRARIDGRAAASGTLVTAPADLSRPFDLVAFGDYGAPTEGFRDVAALAARESPRLLVTMGDNAYLAALPELLDDQVFGPLRAVLAGAPNIGTVGEHDVFFPSGQRALAQAFGWPAGGERYERRHGPLQVIALGLEGDADDAAFLRRALARPGPLARLVVVHRPIRAGNPLVPVIAAADVTAVLAGHLHAYERREVAGAPGVPFLTVGTGGAPRNEERTPRSDDARAHVAEFGLLRVRLEADRATFAFVDVSGRERDRLVAPLLS